MKKKRVNYDCSYKLWRSKLGNVPLEEKQKVPPSLDKLVVMVGISVRFLL
jgi:hypothetical protein